MSNTPHSLKRAAVARETAAHARREALSCAGAATPNISTDFPLRSAGAANTSMVAQAAFPDAQGGSAASAGAAAAFDLQQVCDA